MEMKKIKGLLGVPVVIGILMVVGLFALLPNTVSADLQGATAAVLWEEDFETDGNGSRYTPLEVCNDFGNYFTRTNGTDIGASYVYSGPNNSYFWAVQDTDHAPCTLNPQSIVFQSFSITGSENLIFRGLFAEDDDGINEDWDANTSVQVEYQVDGGAWVEILRFEAVGDTNTEPAEDTDFDGIGDGSRLSPTFTEFAKGIVTSGSMMTVAIRIENLDAGDEDIAFDYFRIEEGILEVDQLSLSKAVSSESGVMANDLVTYTLVLASTGMSSTVVVTDALPAENDFAYWIEQPGGASVSADQVEWMGSVSSTQSITISFAATNTASSGSIVNTAVYSGSGEAGSADATYTAAPPPPVGLICFAESFEVAPGTTYTLSAAFDDGSFDFFNRYAVPDLSNGARDDFETGWDGSYGIMGQDHDGDGQLVTQTVTIAAIDVASATHGIKVQAAFGALDSENFLNYEAGDGFKIYATLDGGARELVGEFAPPAGSGNLMLDTDGDGVGDGDTLTTALADFDFDVTGTGNSLTVEVELVSTSSFEPLALDNVRVLCGAPEHVMINEVDSDTSGTDTLEFVELFDGGFGNMPLDGLVVVGFNGSDDRSYDTLLVDLDGEMTDADGYFVIGNTAVDNVDVVVGSNSIQNGADAVALFIGDDTDFPNDTPLTTVNLLDAFVYDTNDGDDAVLLTLLNDGQPQVNEDGSGNKDGESNQRCANGTGGARNSDTYEQHDPSPGAENVCGFVMEYGFNQIYTIQGNGDASPFDDGRITTVGVVVADFQDDGMGGFNLQDLTGDGDTATSDGIYVFTGDAAVSIPAVNVGDIVTLTAIVDEFNNLTELTEVSAIEVGGTAVVSPTLVTLPLDETEREQLEGMLIQVDQVLYVTEVYELGRYGQILLAPEGRQMQFTHDNAPDVAGYAAHQVAFANNTLKLDDKQTTQNPDPVIYPSPELSATNSLRGGDSVAELTGVMHYSFGEYMLEPTEAVNFEMTNPRPAVPVLEDGSLTVATMNVLNFFTTLDTGPDICGPSANLDCRGAQSVSEFNRQRDKILAALLAMDADIYGLVELENSADNAALQSLVDGLNAVSSSTYAVVETGAIGDDAIRVGFIYKTDTVETVGSFAVLDSSVDANFIESKNRPSLAQTFRQKATGGVFTAAVNHFKSKGSSCDDVSDPNLNDGSGNCNGTRQKAAEALASWLATDPTGSEDEDFMILGDLNAYRNETPITALEGVGYTDLAEHFTGDEAYSYVFSGEWGYLDYALANEPMLDQVVDAAEWHINSDEPIALDYNENFKSLGQIDSFYNDDEYRSSDHDPMIVRVQLNDTMLFFPLIAVE